MMEGARTNEPQLFVGTQMNRSSVASPFPPAGLWPTNKTLRPCMALRSNGFIAIKSSHLLFSTSSFDPAAPGSVKMNLAKSRPALGLGRGRPATASQYLPLALARRGRPRPGRAGSWAAGRGSAEGAGLKVPA